MATLNGWLAYFYVTIMYVYMWRKITSGVKCRALWSYVCCMGCLGNGQAMCPCVVTNVNWNKMAQFVSIEWLRR